MHTTCIPRQGMVHVTSRSSPPLTGSMCMMQLELSTFCAGSCPVARKHAVTILDACALNPPIEPV